MEALVYVVATAGVTLILGLLTWGYTVYRDRQKKPASDIDQAIAQWKEILGGSVAELRQTVTEQREENTRLSVINAEQRETLEKQEEEIDKLEKDVERLELLVRTLTQQNMDVAHEAQRVRRELDELMAKHHNMLGRLEQRGDDVA